MGTAIPILQKRKRKLCHPEVTERARGDSQGQHLIRPGPRVHTSYVARSTCLVVGRTGPLRGQPGSLAETIPMLSLAGA